MEFRNKVLAHVRTIYPAEDAEAITKQLTLAMGVTDVSRPEVKSHRNLWTERDALLVTYANTISEEGVSPLATLRNFIRNRLGGLISGVHVLPFSPYSSDDGFAVINYREVNQGFGDWHDIIALSRETRVMADLVLNHVSSRSNWFDQFKRGQPPGNEFFISIEPTADLSSVVRPRTTPLLTAVDTIDGKKNVWCTFGPDQVDLNFENPIVLAEMISILRFYLDQGIDIFRLDAVAFLWKVLGTPCINLPQTHEIVRLLRTLVEQVNPNAWIITETNLPNQENISYFGNANEAHLIYNFSLPPLLLHGLLKGTSAFLNRWMMSMPPARDGTAYLNFLASHDGIGLRPAEGILDDLELDFLVDAVLERHGRVSWRADSGSNRAYELNISLFDALGEIHGAEDPHQITKFLLAHTIMLGLEGVPAIYIHSLLGTRSDHHRAQMSGHNRAINRHLWNAQELDKALSDTARHHHQILDGLLNLLRIRRAQPAFHPNATQYTLFLGDALFAFWRQSRDREQSIFCLHNLTNKSKTVAVSSINLIAGQTWFDLLGRKLISGDASQIKLLPYQAVWLTNWAESTEI